MKWVHRIHFDENIIKTIISEKANPEVWVSTSEFCEPDHIKLYDLNISVRLYNILKTHFKTTSIKKTALTNIDFNDMRMIRGFGKEMEKQLDQVVKDIQKLP